MNHFLAKNTYESRRYVVGKLFRDDRKTCRQKRCVTHSLDDSYDKTENNEGVVSFDFVKEAEKYGAYSCREYSGVEKEFWANFIQVLPVNGTDYEYD